MKDSAKDFYTTISNKHGVKFETVQEIVHDLLRAGCFRRKADKRYLVEIQVNEMVENGSTVENALFEVCGKYDISYHSAKSWYYTITGERDI